MFWGGAIIGPITQSIGVLLLFVQLFSELRWKSIHVAHTVCYSLAYIKRLLATTTNALMTAVLV
jgi:hypothetical protein